MDVPYWKMGWLPSFVPGIPFDELEESTTAVTTPAATTAPSPVQNHHLLYTGGDSPAGAGAAA
jgi:alkanesulfonate monooxygenase SsuD/methylene tetrahydromethanopterin reductase-like flavin-dependent oxidoreductase (luciferase family)